MKSISQSRYSRQERFAALGRDGQQRLAASRVLICGCGALGSVIAERLARAGVGHLRILDRDWVELSNLQRQSLFTEDDAEQARPKAVAAVDMLSRINGEIKLEAIVDDLSFQNIEGLASGCDLILDGTDNFETRFLINDYCVQSRTPWIHGGCLGSSGQVLSILPGETACFRCLVPDLPPREALETCDSAGVLGPAIGIIASLQAAEALKVLSGNRSDACRKLMVIDTWSTDFRLISLPKNESCKCCSHGLLEFLSGDLRTEATILCGKNAVQLLPPQLRDESLEQIARKAQAIGPVQQNAFFVRLKLPDQTITIFRGGRTVVEGTTSVADAKSILARTLGA